MCLRYPNASSLIYASSSANSSNIFTGEKHNCLHCLQINRRNDLRHRWPQSLASLWLVKVLVSTCTKERQDTCEGLKKATGRYNWIQAKSPSMNVIRSFLLQKLIIWRTFETLILDSFGLKLHLGWFSIVNLMAIKKKKKLLGKRKPRTIISTLPISLTTSWQQRNKRGMHESLLRHVRIQKLF